MPVFNDEKYGELIVKDDLTHGEFKRWFKGIDFKLNGPRHRGSVLRAAINIGIISEPELTVMQVDSLPGHHVRFMANNLINEWHGLINGVKLEDKEHAVEWELKEDITQGQLEDWSKQIKYVENSPLFRESMIIGAALSGILIKPTFSEYKNKVVKREIANMKSKSVTWLFMKLLQEYDKYNAVPEEERILEDEPTGDAVT